MKIPNSPTDDIFKEIKSKSIEIWSRYDNEYGYVDEKLKRINSIKNESDNAMFIVRMFDFPNQMNLLSVLSTESREYILFNQ